MQSQHFNKEHLIKEQIDRARPKMSPIDEKSIPGADNIMAEPLKDMYNEPFFTQFSKIVKQAYNEFDDNRYFSYIFDEEWPKKELKQRIRHISDALHKTLPSPYPEALNILTTIAPKCTGFEYLFFPDFVEAYGLSHWDLSIAALKQFTVYSSSEFAVRPFIEKDSNKMLEILMEWAKDHNEHVRRLASEGCRPRLPWAAPLKMFKENPAPLLPILTLLKADESLYVRKSVANNLNDISKDHPNLVKYICTEWKGQHQYTDWIIKHGCRTLLRKGDHEVLSLFGFHNQADVHIKKLTLSNEELLIGDTLTFQFLLVNQTEEAFKLRIEYGIDFVKANRSTSRKLFKITENIYQNGDTVFKKAHSFKNLSTRKHYPGRHRISIVINGKELAEASFLLHSAQKNETT